MTLRSALKSLPGVRALRNYLRDDRGGGSAEPYARGHFYSPLPDLAQVRADAARLFRRDVELGPSIDLRVDAQEQLLRQLAAYREGFDWPRDSTPGARYYTNQEFFGPGSAFILYAMMRHFRPARIIEVGSGFSSAVMLDTADRFLSSAVEFTFIDPYPDRLHSILRPEDRQRCRVVEDIVQRVPPSDFTKLGANDFLFIDSSHVSKVGSDVNRLVFEVLPLLAPGVIVHVHDIFWPFEYPRGWIESGRAWNEAYLLRAFLQYNAAFPILLFNNFLAHRFPDYVREHLPWFADNPGSSLWLQRG